MKLILQHVMLVITLLLGLNSPAAAPKATPVPVIRPTNMGFGSVQKFSDFLMWNMLDNNRGTNSHTAIDMTVYIYQPPTPDSAYWESPHIEYSDFLQLDLRRPLDEFIRESLSAATQMALNEPSLNLEKELRMEWILDANYAGTNVFKMTRALGAAPNAVPTPPYTTPPAVTNSWKLEWQDAEFAYISWNYASSAHIMLDNGTKIECPRYNGMSIILPFQYATNGYSGRLWITNQNLAGIGREVFVYDLKTGDLVTIQGTKQPIAAVRGAIIDQGYCVTASFTGQKHWPFKVTVRESLDPDSQTYTLRGQFDAEGKGSIALPKDRPTSFIVSAEYESL